MTKIPKSEDGRLLFYGVVQPLPYYHLSSTCPYLMAKIRDPQKRSPKVFRVETYEIHSDLIKSGFFATCPFCSSGVYYNLKINNSYHQVRVTDMELGLILYIADCLLNNKIMNRGEYRQETKGAYRSVINTEVRLIQKGLIYRAKDMPVKSSHKFQRLLTPLGAGVYALYMYRKNRLIKLKDNDKI